jgi:hypothetical protein
LAEVVFSNSGIELTAVLVPLDKYSDSLSDECLSCRDLNAYYHLKVARGHIEVNPLERGVRDIEFRSDRSDFKALHVGDGDIFIA